MRQSYPRLAKFGKGSPSALTAGNATDTGTCESTPASTLSRSGIYRGHQRRFLSRVSSVWRDCSRPEELAHRRPAPTETRRVHPWHKPTPARHVVNRFIWGIDRRQVEVELAPMLGLEGTGFCVQRGRRILAPPWRAPRCLLHLSWRFQSPGSRSWGCLRETDEGPHRDIGFGRLRFWPRKRHAMRMPKPRQTDLEIPPPPRAARKRSTPSRKSTPSRRRLLLLDYATWLAVTSHIADAASRTPDSA